MKLFIPLFTLLFVTTVFGSRHHPSALENEIHDGLKGEFEIYGHHQSHRSELCTVLRCKRNEVCLVKNSNAMCVKKRKLFEIAFEKLPQWLKDEHTNHVQHLENTERHIKHTAKVEKAKYTQEKQLSANGHHKPYFTKQTKKLQQHKQHMHSKSRHMKEKVDTSCSDEQLDAIGGRLKIWFENVHRTEPNTVVHISRHTVSCPREVAWMFGKLDGDSDGVLTPDELESMENDPYEQCLKPFIDRCDTDADDEIDMDEWCDCYVYSGKERQEPPCHKLVHKTDPHLLGAFHPRCDTEGYYKPVQCRENSCWCVDKLGREFDRSRVQNARPDCGQYEEDDNEEDLPFQKIHKRKDHI